MAILNRFSAILLDCDSTLVFASRCGISGDSRPAILGIVRFVIHDSVPLSSELVFWEGYVLLVSPTQVHMHHWAWAVLGGASPLQLKLKSIIAKVSCLSMQSQA